LSDTLFAGGFNEPMKKGLLLFFCVAALASAETYDIVTYGDVVVTTFDGTPVWQITSDPSGTGYGGLDVQITGAFTPADLTSLSATYNQTTGVFVGGAPRFSLWDPSGNEAWDYWGTNSGGCGEADPNAGSPNLNSTGNFITSGAASLASNGFGGNNNPNQCVAFSSFLATGNVSTTQITDITLDVDGGWTANGPQVLDVASVEVNGNTFTPSVATPEPTTFGLFALGLGVIGLASRRTGRGQTTRNW
jgi:hypothetical protein